MMNHFYKQCNHDPKLVFQCNGVSYFASDEDGVRGFNGDLIVNLTKNPGIKNLSTAYKIPQLARHLVELPEEIVIGWQDYGTPPVKASFWNALQQYTKSKKYTNVCFHCMQGHGRTGTGIVSMMIANLGVDAENGIMDLRELYCKHAVESDVQIVYLFQLDHLINDRPMPDQQEMLLILDRLNPKMSKFTTKYHHGGPYHKDDDDDDDDPDSDPSLDLRKIFDDS